MVTVKVHNSQLCSMAIIEWTFYDHSNCVYRLSTLLSLRGVLFILRLIFDRNSCHALFSKLCSLRQQNSMLIVCYVHTVSRNVSLLQCNSDTVLKFEFIRGDIFEEFGNEYLRMTLWQLIFSILPLAKFDALLHSYTNILKVYKIILRGSNILLLFYFLLQWK